MAVDKKAELREKALKDLRSAEVLMENGHFDFGNGYHGPVYVNPHGLFRQPSTIWRFAQDLLDLMPGELMQQIEVVAGPATGGRNAQLTEYDAYLLDQRGYKNHLLNTNAKQFWAAGATASEAAKLLGKSTDYLKKLWGTFSAALETENQVQKGAKP